MNPQHQRILFKDIRLQQYRALAALAQTANFSEAATRLKLDRGSVWRQVRALEREMGVALVQGRGAKLNLTAQGRALAEIVRPVIHDLDAVRGEFEKRQQLAAQTLRLAAPPQVLAYELPPALMRMREHHPDLRITLASATSGTALDQLLSDEVDIAIIGYTDRLRNVEAGLQSFPVTAFPIVALIPPKHPLASRKRLVLRDFIDLPLLLPPQRSSSRPQIDAAFARRGLLARMDVALESNTFTAVLPYVRMGFGIAILGASEFYVRGELTAMADRNEFALKRVAHLFGDEMVFFVTKRTRFRFPCVQEIQQLLCGG